ncbi:hypothetical protein [Aeromicrobium sp.]|uniref:hypothetical protein n=1 Tax=Aeromicrobium sp. TaxID=1871063 RepID=UPI0019B2ED2F|nr:hypothetical protein [Aeromicrobium sp.]MBC7631224.1 hypothetical protein [Aeromicrobium sp.]
MASPGNRRAAGEGAVGGAIGGGILGLVAGVFLSLLSVSVESSTSTSGAAPLVVLTLVLVVVGAVIGAAVAALLGVGVAAVGRQADAGRIPLRVQRLGFSLLMAAGGFFIGGAVVGRVAENVLGSAEHETASVVAAVAGAIIALCVGVVAWRRHARAAAES